MQRYMFVASLMFLVSAVSPALAQQEEQPKQKAEFWVAQDPTTKTCKVVEEIPDGTTKVMIGASSYATKDEAKAARKAAQKAGVCVKTDAKAKKTKTDDAN